MVIRCASLADKNAIFRMAVRETKRYPYLKADKDKIMALVTDAISSAKHFCMVAEADGGIKAVLVGLAGDNMWAQRQFCQISMWVSHLPGAGYKLLREFKEWVRRRPVIRVAGMVVDSDIDERALKMLERIGFTRRGGAYLWYRMEASHGTV